MDPSTRVDLASVVSNLPLTALERRRVLMGVMCRDCDDIPKVAGAGERFTDSTGRRLQRMHNGLVIAEDCYCGRWMTELIRLLGGHHEPQEERAFHEILPHVGRGGTMVELGSWWAYYSMWFGKGVPESQIVLVEPDPVCLETGQVNLALNGLCGTCVSASVGAMPKLPRPFHTDQAGEQMVPEVSVDSLVDQLGLARIDVLLSDIQGAELCMLEGARESIARGLVRFLFLATHHHSISGDPLMHQNCVTRVRDLGGHILLEHDIAESFTGDGLIVASFHPADVHLPPIRVTRNRAGESLFGEPERDVAALWEALQLVNGELLGHAERSPELAAALNRLRSHNPWLGRLWSAAGDGSTEVRPTLFHRVMKRIRRTLPARTRVA